MSTTDAPVRTVPLPAGGALTVRPATPDDADGIGLLYDGLSADDLHLRFFSVCHPPRAFFAHLANAAMEGGFSLIAVVDRPFRRIVGEADYFLLPNGNAELSLTVAPDWRGWLGPYLLDALVESAAARGVPNLEAEILSENRRMLAVMRRRGCATVDGTDFTTARLVVGTSTATPVWPPRAAHPRVLAEVPGGRWRRERAVRAAGLQVMVCPGAGRGNRCPALNGTACPLAAGADLIVCALHDDAVRRAHATVHRGVPVVTQADGATDGGERITTGDTDETVVALLERVLAARGS